MGPVRARVSGQKRLARGIRKRHGFLLRNRLDKSPGQINFVLTPCFMCAILPAMVPESRLGALRLYEASCIVNTSPQRVKGPLRWTALGVSLPYNETDVRETAGAPQGKTLQQGASLTPGGPCASEGLEGLRPSGSWTGGLAAAPAPTPSPEGAPGRGERRKIPPP